MIYDLQKSSEKKVALAIGDTIFTTFSYDSYKYSVSFTICSNITDNKYIAICKNTGAYVSLVFHTFYDESIKKYRLGANWSVL